jgi:hypothetical protein
VWSSWAHPRGPTLQFTSKCRIYGACFLGFGPFSTCFGQFWLDFGPYFSFFRFFPNFDPRVSKQ